MLFWVKLFYPAGVSLSCVMVVMCAGAFIVFCPSEELPPIFYPFFHKHIVQGLTGWNPLYKQSTLCVTFPFSGAIKCWCGTIATMFSQAPGRDSQDLCRFSSWMYLFDGEDNCMLSVPFSTCDLHFSCWRSGENCQAVAAGASMLLGYALWFSSKGECSPNFSVLLSCPRVVCSMFPVF